MMSNWGRILLLLLLGSLGKVFAADARARNQARSRRCIPGRRTSSMPGIMEMR